METILHLLSPAYLFNKNHGPFTSDLAVLFIGFDVGLIILAIIIRRLAKKSDIFGKKAAHKFGNLAWTMGAIGIILYIFRQINILYLSAPFVILVWLAVLIIWLILVINYRYRIVPKRRHAIKTGSQKDEYIP